jgi:hypothetical protein
MYTYICFKMNQKEKMKNESFSESMPHYSLCGESKEYMFRYQLGRFIFFLSVQIMLQ